MTDDTPPKPGANEPSMDDILASIRRILAEDSTDDADKGAAVQPLTSSLFDETEFVPDTTADAKAEPVALAFDDETTEEEPPAVPPRPPSADVFVLTPNMRLGADPEMPSETRLVSPPPLRAAMPAGERRVVSTPAADVSADVLSHLAKAILDRRDIAIGARDVTLEGMVREMLRPMLREWLDRNLPYLIERLVKKEIDLMVNRAERLDD